MYGQDFWQDAITRGDIIPVLGICLGLIVGFLGLLGGLSIAFVKVLRGGGASRRVRELDRQEAEAFQGLQRGFQRMEERIESLETLMMGHSQERSYRHD